MPYPNRLKDMLKKSFSRVRRENVAAAQYYRRSGILHITRKDDAESHMAFSSEMPLPLGQCLLTFDDGPA
jgi:hypothetical protein